MEQVVKEKSLWTKAEFQEVFKAFKKNGEKDALIDESQDYIKELANQLSRPVRGVENQLLLVRWLYRAKIEKTVYKGRNRASKLLYEVWNETYPAYNVDPSQIKWFQEKCEELEADDPMPLPLEYLTEKDHELYESMQDMGLWGPRPLKLKDADDGAAAFEGAEYLQKEYTSFFLANEVDRLFDVEAPDSSDQMVCKLARGDGGVLVPSSSIKDLASELDCSLFWFGVHASQPNRLIMIPVGLEAVDVEWLASKFNRPSQLDIPEHYISESHAKSATRHEGTNVMHHLLSTRLEQNPRYSYILPVFQRRYVWAYKKNSEYTYGERTESEYQDKAEINYFLNDLLLLVKETDPVQFMGSLVFQRDTDSNEYWIVDGQQRMLTTQLALIALSSLAVKTFQPKLAMQLMYQYVVHRWNTPKAGQPIVVPCYEDRAFYYSLIEDVLAEVDGLGVEDHFGGTVSNRTFAHPPHRFPGPSAGATNIEKAYQAIYRELEANLFDGGRGKRELAPIPGRLCEVAKRLLFSMTYCQMTLSKNEDASCVFDGLNMLGRRLELSELWFNKIAGKFNDDTVASNFKMTSYRPIEEHVERVAEAGWKPKTAKDKFANLMSDSILVFGKVELDGNATRSSVLPNLWKIKKNEETTPLATRQRAVTDLFALYKGAYRELPEGVAARFNEDQIPVSQQLEFLGYCALRVRLGNNESAAYLCWLTNHYLNKEFELEFADLLQTLKLFCSLDFYTSLVAKAPLSGWQGTLRPALDPNSNIWDSDVGNPKILAKRILELQSYAPTLQVVASKQQVKARLSSDEFWVGCKEDSVIRKIVCLCEEVFSERITDFDDFRSVAHWHNLSCEHIFPQKPDKGYDQLQGLTDIEQEKYCYKIGNSVGLTGPKNSRGGNKPWDKKRQIYRNQTVWKTPAELADKPKWTSREIDVRSKKLIDLILKRFVHLSYFHPSSVKYEQRMDQLSP